MNEFQTIVDDVTERVRQLIDTITTRINALPDNPRIKRLGHNCFVVCSKDMATSWLPSYHDFKRQYRLVIEAIERSNPIDVLVVLQRIVEDGRVQDGMGSKTYIRLHADVVDHLKTLLV